MKNKNKLLIVTPYFPPQGGGLEKYAYEIAKRLKSGYGWEVVFITSGEKKGKYEKTEENGITIYKLGYDFKISNTPLSLRWLSKIKRILKAEKPDVINIHTPVPGIGDMTSLLAGKIPIVVTYHAGSMHKKKFVEDIFISFYENFLLKVLLLRANQIVCSSDFVRKGFLHNYQYKSSTISPATDIELFKKSGKINKEKKVILFVAGLNRSEQYKGLKILIDAVKSLSRSISGIKLTVVGDGDMKEEYIHYAKDHGLEGVANFRGKLHGKDLIAEYHKAAVFVLPTSNDSYPTVIVEAMAAGLPVVSTKVGGIPTLVDDGKTGYLVKPNNINELTLKLQEILNNPKLAKDFGLAGQNKISKGYDWSDRTKVYDELFIHLIGKDLDRKTKILVIAPYFYPKIGGLENYAYNIAKRLQNIYGFQIVVITSNHESKHYKLDMIDNMKIHRLPIWFKISNTPVNPLWYFWIKRIIDIEKPNVIHAHTPVPFISDMAERGRGNIPFFLTYHNDLYKQKLLEKFIVKIVYLFLINSTLDNSDVVIATSKYYAKKSPYLKELKKEVVFVPPGVDLTAFNTGVDNEWLKKKYKNIYTVLFVGQLDKTHDHKGLDVLLSAVKNIQNKGIQMQLVIVGGGNGLQKYKENVASKKLKNVVFAGRVDDKDLPFYYSGSDVTVLPSKSNSEGFGMVLIEANACGRPVIGSEIGGIPNVISNEKNGLLVKPEDINSLDKAIEKLYSNTTLSREMGRYGAAMVKKLYGWEMQTEKYIQLFKSYGRE